MADEDIQAQDGLVNDDIQDEITDESVDTDDDDGGSTEKVTIGDKEYDPKALSELIEAGEKAKSIEAESTKRFQAAAEDRKTIEAERKELESWINIRKAWEGGVPEEGITKDQARELISRFFQRETGADVKGLDRETLATDEEKAIYDFVKQRSEAQEAKIARLESLIAKIEPVLGNVSKYIDGDKSEREATLAAQEIKAKHGLDVTPAQVKEWREKGVDPLAMFEIVKPWLTAVQAGGKGTDKKESDIPSGTDGRTYDPNDPKLSADDMYDLQMKGYKPRRS